MERLFIFFVMYVAFVWSVAEANKSKLFQKKYSQDGKICQGTDIAFSKVVDHDKTICLLECANHVDCVSIFHVRRTGNCTGCTASYDTASILTGLARGSIYYGYAKCPDGWFTIKQSCYFITWEDRNFEKGVAQCQSQNAHAVIINDEEENTNLKSKINSSTFSDVRGFYTAFTDTAVEGIWTVYSTADEITFTDWAKEEPNMGTNENCLALFVSFGLRWADVSCDGEQLRMICEKEN